MNNYISVIGIEIHVQLNTKSKLFCRCSTKFGEKPNTNICPICMGLPGVLPSINMFAIEKAIKAAISLNCNLNLISSFARKNYFYPDLPKGYQITQFKTPLAENGFIELDNGKRIRIRRIHIEEDSGKLIHDIDKDSLVDLNRAGVPLIEIVSEPDIRNSAEAIEYLKKLKRILKYIEISDCNMEKGELRAEPNISIMKKEAKEFGVKTEIKNLNSFKAVKNGIELEIKRQIEIVEAGNSIVSETLLYDEKKQRVYPMRKKESAGDYRYFPEPDLPDLKLEDSFIEKIKKEIPELPEIKKKRFLSEYALKKEAVEAVIDDKYIAEYFEKVFLKYKKNNKLINFFIKEFFALINRENIDTKNIPIKHSYMTELFELIDNNSINLNSASVILKDMFDSSDNPKSIMKKRGLEQLSDNSEIEIIVKEVLENNKKEVERYKNGENKLFGFFVGQIMKKTKGKANPKLVNEILKKLL